jgi:hypothetical protein
MPLSFNQIVAQACQDANVPGFTATAQTKLNVILQELAQDWSFVAARKTLQFSLPTATVTYGGGQVAPYNLPADYLRACRDECFYYISGVPYVLIPVELDEFDRLVATPGLQNFPTVFASDMSTAPPNGPNAVAYFWMPPSGSYAAVIRYQSAPADVVDFTATPWFPNTNYLLTRLTGELCKTTDDERHAALLSSDEDRYPGGAGVILRQYMKMQNDAENKVKRVTLDRRVFGAAFDRLRNTKQIGW